MNMKEISSLFYIVVVSCYSSNIDGFEKWESNNQPRLISPYSRRQNLNLESSCSYQMMKIRTHPGLKEAYLNAEKAYDIEISETPEKYCKITDMEEAGSINVTCTTDFSNFLLDYKTICEQELEAIFYPIKVSMTCTGSKFSIATDFDNLHGCVSSSCTDTEALTAVGDILWNMEQRINTVQDLSCKLDHEYPISISSYYNYYSDDISSGAPPPTSNTTIASAQNESISISKQNFIMGFINTCAVMMVLITI